MTSNRQRIRHFQDWMRQPPVLMRWKVAVTAVAALILVSGLYYQTNYRNQQQTHATECARAEGREAVRLVLFRITALSDIFPSSDAVKLYESSTHAIIEAALPPIEVAHCPTTNASTLRSLQWQLQADPPQSPTIKETIP